MGHSRLVSRRIQSKNVLNSSSNKTSVTPGYTLVTFVSPSYSERNGSTLSIIRRAHYRDCHQKSFDVSEFLEIVAPFSVTGQRRRRIWKLEVIVLNKCLLRVTRTRYFYRHKTAPLITPLVFRLFGPNFPDDDSDAFNSIIFTARVLWRPFSTKRRAFERFTAYYVSLIVAKLRRSASVGFTFTVLPRTCA